MVGSDIPGIREVLADGRAGRLVPTGDVVALAAAIDALLRDPDERARLAGVGRAFVERRFTARRMVDEVAATYDERLAAHPSVHEPNSPSTKPTGEAGRIPTDVRLRRVDWRFLVPGGPRLGRVVLVGGDSSLDAAVRDVASAVVEAGSDAAADVVVAADPTNRTSDRHRDGRAWSDPRDRARPPERTRTHPPARAASAGSERTSRGRGRRCLSALADRRRGRAPPVPQSRRRGGPPIRRLAGLGRVVVFEARLATGRGPRRVDVWTRDGADPAPNDGVAHRGASRSGPDELLARVSTPDVDLGPAPFTWSLLTPGGRTVSKVVALGGPRGQRPRVVVKSPRTPAAARGLRHEATVLAALAQAHPAMLGSTPRLLGLVDHPDGPSLVETYLHGARLTRVLTARTFERLSDLVVASLLQLVGPGDIDGADASSGDPIVTPDPAGPTGSLDGIVERFRIGVAGRADPVLLEESMALARGLSSLPVATEHRDPGPWNLLVGKGTSTFDAELVGMDPALDLALLKIEATGLQALPFGNANEVKQGELVMAFGSSLGMDNSVSMGIVSAAARQLTAMTPGSIYRPMPPSTRKIAEGRWSIPKAT